MKKLWKLALASLMVVSLAACSSNETTDEDANATADATAETTEECAMKVGLVTDTGGVDDKSFNQSAWEGIERFAEDNNLGSDCYGYLQSTADADYLPNLQSYADEGYDLVVACGYLFQEAIDTVSAQYPDTNFLFIDSVGENSEENTMSAIFAAQDGSFLVGVAAGLVAKDTEANAVGFMGGMEGPLIGAFQAGFEQGVIAVNPDATIYVDYADSFSDDAKAQQIGEKQYSAGVSVIYQAAGNAGNGIIKAAKERGDVWAIGVDRDQYEEGMTDNGSIILTSMIKRVDTATYTACSEIQDGTFVGDVTTFGLADEGIGAELSSGRNLTDEQIATIQGYADQIKAGEIVVSDQATIANGKTNKSE